jgi:phosphoribosylanthranilate isomerase
MCGITRREDAAVAAEAGADALGFVLTPSPRRVTAEVVREIVRELPPHVLRVGVFVDEGPAEIARAAAAADVDRVQVHGDPDPILRDLLGARFVRAFRVHDENVLEAIRDSGENTFLLDAWSPDAPGGTGLTFDWSVARRAREWGRVILAGGLHAENVGRAIRDALPFGVDVSSGVEEEPGRKSAERIRAFVKAVRDADREISAAEAAEEGADR